MDVSWCTTRISTGSAVPPAEIGNLRHVGVTMVFDSRIEVDDSAAYGAGEVLYLRLGTADDGQGKGEQYWGTMLKYVMPWFPEPGIRIHFQCGSGVNRGPSAAFCTMVALGWTPEAAEAAIRASRPSVGLAYRDDVVRTCRKLGYIT
jgi:hypothetical protein